MQAKKIRLDRILLEKGIATTRQRARAMIMAGKILVNHLPADKPGTMISPDAGIEIKGEDIPYVSRGGLKLEAALNAFELKVVDRVCLDVGASTGGFTDCMLQNGATRVYAVDVGYGQLAWKLRQDPRVVVIERTNIRHMPPGKIPEPIGLATIDVSFISLKIVVPAILDLLAPDSEIVALIKPQFEVGKGQVGKGGVVRNPEHHERVIKDLANFFQKLGLICESVIPSPVIGPKGNREFLILLKNGPLMGQEVGPKTA